MKSSELLRLLKKHGWTEIRQSGSHIIMEHPEKQNLLTLPFHASKEVKNGLLQALLKQADIDTAKR